MNEMAAVVLELRQVVILRVFVFVEVWDSCIYRDRHDTYILCCEGA